VRPRFAPLVSRTQFTSPPPRKRIVTPLPPFDQSFFYPLPFFESPFHQGSGQCGLVWLHPIAARCEVPRVCFCTPCTDGSPFLRFAAATVSFSPVQSRAGAVPPSIRKPLAPFSARRVPFPSVPSPFSPMCPHHLTSPDASHGVTQPVTISRVLTAAGSLSRSSGLCAKLLACGPAISRLKLVLPA